MGGGDTLDAFVTKKDPRTMIQSRFDSGPDLSVMNDKDTLKAAKRAERDIKKAQAAAEAAAAEVMGHLQGSKPTIRRNQCAFIATHALAQRGRGAATSGSQRSSSPPVPSAPVMDKAASGQEHPTQDTPPFMHGVARQELVRSRWPAAAC